MSGNAVWMTPTLSIDSSQEDTALLDTSSTGLVFCSNSLAVFPHNGSPGIPLGAGGGRGGVVGVIGRAHVQPHPSQPHGLRHQPVLRQYGVGVGCGGRLLFGGGQQSGGRSLTSLTPGPAAGCPRPISTCRGRTSRRGAWLGGTRSSGAGRPRGRASISRRCNDFDIIWTPSSSLLSLNAAVTYGRVA